MTSTYGVPAWYARLSPIQRELLETLAHVEQELEDSAPLDRLRVLARVRQAQVDAWAAWGKGGQWTD